MLVPLVLLLVWSLRRRLLLPHGRLLLGRLLLLPQWGGCCPREGSC